MVIKSDLSLEEKNNYYQKKLPENVPSLLLSSVYIGEKKSVFLKFYNPEDSQIYFWSESFIENHVNKHQPYCFVKELYADQVRIIVSKESHRFKLEKIKKMDDIEDREISVFKIIAPTLFLLVEQIIVLGKRLLLGKLILNTMKVICSIWV